MKTEFSPGPWQLKSPYKKPVSIWDKEDKLIVSVVHGEDLSNRQSNARLIAAAPELLDALQLARNILHQKYNYTALEHFDNIIEKAKGKSQ